MRRRWWLFRLFDLIAYYWPVAKPRRGLLVVRMDGIGDMVLFRRALDHYTDVFGYQKSEITVLGCQSWAAVAGALFEGYRIEIINEHRYAKRPLYRFGVNLRVRRIAPEVTLNDAFFRRALMADSVSWMSRAKRTIASQPYISERTRPEFTYYMSQVDEAVDTGLYPTHEIERHYRFLSAVAGREIKPEPPRLTWPAGQPPVDAGAPYIVLNPGSNEFGRRWPLANYVDLARSFLAQNYRVAVIGKADEKASETGFKAISGEPGLIDLTGQTDVPGMFDLLAGAALVVSNDTGPAHVSIGLGRPTVVIVGGGHFGSFVPYPEAVTPGHVRFVFERMECYHCFWSCYKRTDPKASFPCVAGVSSETVWLACQNLLAEQPPSDG